MDRGAPGPGGSGNGDNLTPARAPRRREQRELTGRDAFRHPAKTRVRGQIERAPASAEGPRPSPERSTARVASLTVRPGRLMSRTHGQQSRATASTRRCIVGSCLNATDLGLSPARVTRSRANSTFSPQFVDARFTRRSVRPVEGSPRSRSTRRSTSEVCPTPPTRTSHSVAPYRTTSAAWSQVSGSDPPNSSVTSARAGSPSYSLNHGATSSYLAPSLGVMVTKADHAKDRINDEPQSLAGPAPLVPVRLATRRRPRSARRGAG
jgi:hypothetical protein